MEAEVIKSQEDMVEKTSVIALDESIPVLERLTRTMLSLNMDNEVGEKGKTIYHVKNFIQETGDFVDDGLHSIFVNTVCDDG